MMIVMLSPTLVSPVAAAVPPGVGDVPATVESPTGWTYQPYYTTYEWSVTYYGVKTVTSFDKETLLTGPVVSGLLILGKPYIKSASLTLQRITSYRPVFLVGSTSWYSHSLEMSASSSEQFKCEFTAGINVKAGTCSILGGGSTTTTTTSSFGWTVTASGGDTKVVYLRMIFLRVFGTVTYNKAFGQTETRQYSVTVLEEVSFDNYYTVIRSVPTYYEIPVASIDYYDSPTDGDAYADKYYDIGTKWYSYTQATETSAFFGVDLKLGSEKIAFTGSAKFTWTNSASLTLKHSFTGTVPDDVLYYYLRQDNFFNVNIDPIYDGGDDWTHPGIDP